MKYSFILVLFFCLFAVKTAGQELTQKENTLLEDFMKTKVAMEKEKIVSDTLQKVFQGSVYRVKAGYSDESGISYCTDNLFIIKDGALIAFTSKDIKAALRPGFMLKNVADAKIFETALDKISPVSWDNEQYKEHLKIANNWYFVRGKFFDSKSAYVVAVDPSGKITGVSYEMEAIKK